MSSENRWPEYDAKTLVPPVVVQHDTMASGEHLVWVYAADGITGPYSRKTYDAVAVLAEIVESLAVAEEAANAEEVLA